MEVNSGETVLEEACKARISRGVYALRDGTAENSLGIRGPEHVQGRPVPRCPALSRSMSVRKVPRWSLRADARMVKGMKAVGKRVLSNEAANGQRPHQQQGAGRHTYSFFAPRESSLTCTAEDQNPKPAEEPRIMHAWPKRVAIKASASFFDRAVPVCESSEKALEQRHAVQHVHGSGARPD